MKQHPNQQPTLPHCNAEHLTAGTSAVVMGQYIQPEHHTEGIPLFLSAVAAGFPSPADDFIERKLDLNEHLVKNAVSTFFVRAQGDSMIGAGIHDGDMLIVDRSMQAAHNKVIIAAVHGELTVKRLWKKQGRMFLLPENSAYKPLEITTLEDVFVWGVVTYVIHSL